MKQTELGKLTVDCGDVVVFSMDSVLKLMRLAGYKNAPAEVDDFLLRFQGIACRFDADGQYAVDAVTAVDAQGGEHYAVLIGAPLNSTLK